MSLSQFGTNSQTIDLSVSGSGLYLIVATGYASGTGADYIGYADVGPYSSERIYKMGGNNTATIAEGSPATITFTTTPYKIFAFHIINY